jgi:hypothetical protein
MREARTRWMGGCGRGELGRGGSLLGRGGMEGASWAARQSRPWRGEEGTAGWARLRGGLFPFLSYFFISSSLYFEFSSSF